MKFSNEKRSARTSPSTTEMASIRSELHRNGGFASHDRTDPRLSNTEDALIYPTGFVLVHHELLVIDLQQGLDTLLLLVPQAPFGRSGILGGLSMTDEQDKQINEILALRSNLKKIEGFWLVRLLYLSMAASHLATGVEDFTVVPG